MGGSGRSLQLHQRLPAMVRHRRGRHLRHQRRLAALDHDRPEQRRVALALRRIFQRGAGGHFPGLSALRAGPGTRRRGRQHQRRVPPGQRPIDRPAVRVRGDGRPDRGFRLRAAHAGQRLRRQRHPGRPVCHGHRHQGGHAQCRQEHRRRAERGFHPLVGRRGLVAVGTDGLGPDFRCRFGHSDDPGSPRQRHGSSERRLAVLRQPRPPARRRRRSRPPAPDFADHEAAHGHSGPVALHEHQLALAHAGGRQHRDRSHPDGNAQRRGQFAAVRRVSADQQHVGRAPERLALPVEVLGGGNDAGNRHGRHQPELPDVDQQDQRPDPRLHPPFRQRREQRFVGPDQLQRRPAAGHGRLVFLLLHVADQQSADPDQRRHEPDPHPLHGRHQQFHRYLPGDLQPDLAAGRRGHQRHHRSHGQGLRRRLVQAPGRHVGRRQRHPLDQRDRRSQTSALLDQCPQRQRVRHQRVLRFRGRRDRRRRGDAGKRRRFRSRAAATGLHQRDAGRVSRARQRVGLRPGPHGRRPADDRRPGDVRRGQRHRRTVRRRHRSGERSAERPADARNRTVDEHSRIHRHHGCACGG